MAKRQKVDATTRLRVVDPRIHMEATLLGDILFAVQKTRANRQLVAQLKRASSLYVSYRGTGFPLKTRANRIPPPWRSLSPWMKLQVAGLCLAERSFLQFRITFPTGLLDYLQQEGRGAKEYMRDDLRRRARRAFNAEPWFFFSLEERSVDGELVPIHLHGSILVRPLPLPATKAGHLPVRWARLVAELGCSGAKVEHGREVMRRALRRSIGLDGQPHQCWSRKPYLGRSNPDWISYSLKNMFEPSSDLPDRRMVISRGLTQEAQRLWELMLRGNLALAQW